MNAREARSLADKALSASSMANTYMDKIKMAASKGYLMVELIPGVDYDDTEDPTNILSSLGYNCGPINTVLGPRLQVSWL